MAKPIGNTPTLEGKNVREFLKRMKCPPTKGDLELKRKIDEQRKVYF